MNGLWSDDTGGIVSGGLVAKLGGKIPYIISEPVLATYSGAPRSLFVRTTEYIIARYDGNAAVMIDERALKLILSQPPRRFQSRVDALLSEMSRRTDHSLSINVNLRHNDAATNDLCRLTSSGSLGELYHLLIHAQQKGWANCLDSPNSERIRARLTGDGFTYLDQQAATSVISNMTFVAMWFNDATATAYAEGIEPAIRANGYEPIRIDRKEHNGKIDDEIILEIRRSRFVVADFSCGLDGARGGVYFEAGFALALEKPVIWTVRAGDLGRVHFDTRQFNHIDWADPEDLRVRLERRIGAVVGPYGL